VTRLLAVVLLLALTGCGVVDALRHHAPHETQKEIRR